MRLASVNVDLIQVFVIINRDGLKIKVDVNEKNWLTKEYVIKNLIKILVIVNMNVINHVMLENYKNCKCRNSLLDKLTEECNENIDEKTLQRTELHSHKMIYNSTLNDYKRICSSCTIYIVFFVKFSIISVSISSVFNYFHWYLKRKYIETVIYWMHFSWTYKWEILSKLILKIIQKILQKYWHLQYWLHYKKKNWWIAKVNEYIEAMETSI